MIILYICKTKFTSFISYFFNKFFLLYHILHFTYRLIDNLPAATKKFHKGTNSEVVYHGYRLGGVIGDQVYINNHLILKLGYHEHGEYVLFMLFHIYIIILYIY